jgi:hypothetical protein
MGRLTISAFLLVTVERPGKIYHLSRGSGMISLGKLRRWIFIDSDPRVCYKSANAVAQLRRSRSVIDFTNRRGFAARVD